MQGDGFGLVYSITSRLSFEQLPNLYTAILRVKDAGMPAHLLEANLP